MWVQLRRVRQRHRMHRGAGQRVYLRTMLPGADMRRTCKHEPAARKTRVLDWLPGGSTAPASMETVWNCCVPSAGATTEAGGRYCARAMTRSLTAICAGSRTCRPSRAWRANAPGSAAAASIVDALAQTLVLWRRSTTRFIIWGGSRRVSTTSRGALAPSGPQIRQVRPSRRPDQPGRTGPGLAARAAVHR